MTGGTDQASEINRNLGRAAQEAGIAMGLGSQRVAIEDPNLSDTFNVRDVRARRADVCQSGRGSA